MMAHSTVTKQLLPDIEELEAFYVPRLQELTHWVIGTDIPIEDIEISTRLQNRILHIYILVPRERRGRLIGREGNTSQLLQNLISIIVKTNQPGLSSQLHITDDNGVRK